MHEGDDFARELLRCARRFQLQDREFAFRIRIVDPVIEAAALQRIVDFTRAVRRDDDDGRMFGLDGADFGDAYLKVGQHLQKICLEGLVRAVEFVDQQDGRAFDRGFERLQDRTADEKAFGEDILAEFGAVLDSLSLRQPDFDHLRLIVPLINGGARIEAFVALEADKAAAERIGQHLCDLRLADARFAFKKERAAHFQREEDDGGKRAVGDIVAAREKLDRFVDIGWQTHELNPGRKASLKGYPAAATARFAITVTRWARYSALP